jgi:hypothetical protein
VKTIAAIVLLSCFAVGQDKAAISAAEAACGPRDVGFDVTAEESQHPTPTPEDGKAVIYVVQESNGSTRVGGDGQWLGALKARTYFSASLDPGEHHLCAIYHLSSWSFVSLHDLKAEVGETYYFVANLVGGVFAGEFALRQVNPDEGKYLVAKAKFSVSHPK